MKLAIATDAWAPQLNGVVTTLMATIAEMERRGVTVDVIAPDRFITVPMPRYAEIRLAIAPRLGVRRGLGVFAPDVVHIVTEGPIGWAARRWCLDHDVPFTSAFHTRFPDYAALRTGLSPDHFWPIMRRFHARSEAVFVSTPRLRDELASRGMPHGRLWSRGIDATLFRPDGALDAAIAALPRPIHLSVGRIALEKNLEAFLDLPLPGSKVLVGDGPALPALRQRYPDAHFVGPLRGDALADAYRAADVFVFPSRTDTFGLVIIEALACGVPVAAYPVAGPQDILGHAPDVAGLNPDLGVAIARALRCDRAKAAAFGAQFDWKACTDQFMGGLFDAMRPPLIVAAE